MSDDAAMVVEFDSYGEDHSVEVVEVVEVLDDGSVLDEVTIVESEVAPVVDDVDDIDDSDDVMVLEEVDNELVLMVWEPTGEPQVDEALDLLATLDVDNVHQHAAVYSEIHEHLRSTLTHADVTSE